MFGQLKSLTRTFKTDRSGSPAVEFALVSPLLFLTVLGTFEIGKALYERNKITAAAAVATRAVVIKGPADEAAILKSIEDELHAYKQENLSVVFSNVTIDGVGFKKIEITYQHKALVHFGSHFGNLSLKAVRYAPSIE